MREMKVELKTCLCNPLYGCAPMPNRFRKGFKVPTADAATPIAQCDLALMREFGAGHETAWCQSMEPHVRKLRLGHVMWDKSCLVCGGTDATTPCVGKQEEEGLCDEERIRGEGDQTP